jgi:hypothetical protein
MLLGHGQCVQAGMKQVVEILKREAGGAIIGGRAPSEFLPRQLPRPQNKFPLRLSEFKR